MNDVYENNFAILLIVIKNGEIVNLIQITYQLFLYIWSQITNNYFIALKPQKPV